MKYVVITLLLTITCLNGQAISRDKPEKDTVIVSSSSSPLKDTIDVNNKTFTIPSITDKTEITDSPTPTTTIPTPVTTPNSSSTSTPSSPTTTSTTTTTTAIPSSTSETPTPPTKKPTVPTITTAAPITHDPATSVKPPVDPTTAVPDHHRRFDGPSFIGGIVLALGLVAIGFVAFKFYKARTELNYHTL